MKEKFTHGGLRITVKHVVPEVKGPKLSSTCEQCAFKRGSNLCAAAPLCYKETGNGYFKVTKVRDA